MKENHKHGAIIIPMKADKQPALEGNLLDQAQQAEKKEDHHTAISLYKQYLKSHSKETLPYNRLMIIYRKEKRYKDELTIINKAISEFESMYKKRAQQRTAKNEKVEALSKSLARHLGLTDKKGNDLYQPEPIASWQKRKEIVLKKLK